MKKELLLVVLIAPLLITLQSCSGDKSVSGQIKKSEESIKKMKAGEMTIEEELKPLNMDVSQERYKARELVVRNVGRIKKQHEKKLEEESGETAEKERIKRSIKTWMDRVE